MLQLIILSSGFGLWVILIHRAFRNKKASDVNNCILYTLVSLLMLINIFLFLSYNLESLYIPLLINSVFRQFVINTVPAVYTILRWITLLVLTYFFVPFRSPKEQFIAVGFVLVGALLSAISNSHLIDELLYGPYFLLFLTIALIRIRKRLLIYLLLPPLWLNAFLKITGIFEIEPGFWIYHRLTVFFLFSIVILIKQLDRNIGKGEDFDFEDFYSRHNISKRERDVLHMLINHSSYKEITESLHISIDTVKSHARSIYRKTGVKNRNELIRYMK